MTWVEAPLGCGTAQPGGPAQSFEQAGPKLRWKAALNAFDITFDGRISAGRK